MHLYCGDGQGRLQNAIELRSKLVRLQITYLLKGDDETWKLAKAISKTREYIKGHQEIQPYPSSFPPPRPSVDFWICWLL